LSGRQSKLLSRMANMEKQRRMVQLLDPGQLINEEEMIDLKSVR